MEIIKKVRQFVKEECKKPTSKYGYEPFEFHFVYVVKRAKKLAKDFNADIELIEIAAWLHDIGSIMYGRSDHHITGSKIAEKKLKEFGYPDEKIELVKKCIMNHRGSVPKIRKSIEEQIIAEADAISVFDSIASLFDVALVYEKLSRKEAEKSVRDKLERKWKQLQFEKSKKAVRPRYDAAMLLLNKIESKK